MPASGARGVWSCGGGQSAVGPSRLPLHQPGDPWARAPASGFGSGVSGQKGRNRTAGCETGRRRIVKSGVVRGRTGDIAHLERAQYFAFCSPCQALSLFLLLSPSLHIPLHFPLRHTSALCSNFVGVNSGRTSAPGSASQAFRVSPSGEEQGVSCAFDTLLSPSSHPSPPLLSFPPRLLRKRPPRKLHRAFRPLRPLCPARFPNTIPSSSSRMAMNPSGACVSA